MVNAVCGSDAIFRPLLWMIFSRSFIPISPDPNFTNNVDYNPLHSTKQSSKGVENDSTLLKWFTQNPLK